jgi:hypothetical protein
MQSVLFILLTRGEDQKANAGTSSADEVARGGSRNSGATATEFCERATLFCYERSELENKKYPCGNAKRSSLSDDETKLEGERLYFVMSEAS